MTIPLFLVIVTASSTAIGYKRGAGQLTVTTTVAVSQPAALHIS